MHTKRRHIVFFCPHPDRCGGGVYRNREEKKFLTGYPVHHVHTRESATQGKTMKRPESEGHTKDTNGPPATCFYRETGREQGYGRHF